MANKENYLGNKNLKRSSVNIEWTKELILEYQKCSDDQIYFIKKYCKIVNVDKGMSTLSCGNFKKK